MGKKNQLIDKQDQIIKSCFNPKYKTKPVINQFVDKSIQINKARTRSTKHDFNAIDITIHDISASAKRDPLNNVVINGIRGIISPETIKASRNKIIGAKILLLQPGKQKLIFYNWDRIIFINPKQKAYLAKLYKKNA